MISDAVLLASCPFCWVPLHLHKAFQFHPLHSSPLPVFTPTLYFSGANVKFTKSYCVFLLFVLAPGGTRIDDNDKTKMTSHCVFFAEEDHDAIRNYAQVGIIKGLLFSIYESKTIIVEHL